MTLRRNRKPKDSPRFAQRGLVLLVVLWTVLLLCLIATSMLDTSRTDVNLARNLVGATRAELLAETAANVALYALVNRADSEDAWRRDGSVYAWREEDGELRARVTQEEGRIDLNEAPVDLLASLLVAAGVEDPEARQIADAIADFRDSDSDRREYGAEDADYDNATQPLGAKDGPFETIDELLRVPGMTIGVFQRIKPALTIFTRLEAPEPESAMPLVRAALEETVADQIETSDSAIEETADQPLEDMPTLVDEGTGQRGGSRGLYRIEAAARLPDGSSSGIETIILLSGRPKNPFRVLEKRRGDATLFSTVTAGARP